ncbi:MAG: HNH endonuclease [Deltaproteobacteria bacterium]|nr:HNH endonuclease [Deltaproteobacteria bacterium]
MIAQKELIKILNYNPETGIFMWKISTNRKIKIGDIAGHLDKQEGYIVIWVNKKKYLAHRLAWFYVYGVWPEKDIDHDDHNRANNAIGNLNNADKQSNAKNMSLRCDNKSGVTGVTWHKETSKWIANIAGVYLGGFTDKFEAICARMSANNKHGFHENHGRIL